MLVIIVGGKKYSKVFFKMVLQNSKNLQEEKSLGISVIQHWHRICPM
jgi:hypothetical protein